MLFHSLLVSKQCQIPIWEWSVRIKQSQPSERERNFLARGLKSLITWRIYALRIKNGEISLSIDVLWTSLKSICISICCSLTFSWLWFNWNSSNVKCSRREEKAPETISELHSVWCYSCKDYCSFAIFVVQSLVFLFFGKHRNYLWYTEKKVIRFKRYSCHSSVSSEKFSL